MLYYLKIKIALIDDTFFPFIINYEFQRYLDLAAVT